MAKKVVLIPQADAEVITVPVVAREVVPADALSGRDAAKARLVELKAATPRDAAAILKQKLRIQTLNA